MRKTLFLMAFSSLSFGLFAQTNSLSDDKGAVVGIKTNALYWATATPNLGVEVRLAPKWTLEAEVGLNPFTNKHDDGSFGKSIKHFRLHPELGLHVPYLIYNVSDIKLLGTEDERHQGWGTGVGLSYGYSWVVGKHWNIEATVGVGYLYLESDKYPCTNCGQKIETTKKHYFGPTQAAVSAIYVF